MFDEAVVLAGGLGTRLRSEVQDVPKPMAPIAGRPFLEYLLGKLEAQGLSRIILSVGYKHEIIRAHFKSRWRSLEIDYCVEDTPLGTGGALVEAFKKVKGTAAFALNGDTVLDEDYTRLVTPFVECNSDFCLFVREIDDGGRYDICDLDGDRVTGFSSGKNHQAGCINAGVYLIQKELIDSIDKPDRFSFEKDFLPQAAQSNLFTAVKTKAEFIDIGIPDSFKLAQSFIPALGL